MRTNVKTTNETSIPRMTKSGRKRLLPAMLVPKTMGISGKMQGRRIVSRPARKRIVKIVIVEKLIGSDTRGQLGIDQSFAGSRRRCHGVGIVSREIKNQRFG